jgi:hypothetical protein
MALKPLPSTPINPLVMDDGRFRQTRVSEY